MAQSAQRVASIRTMGIDARPSVIHVHFFVVAPALIRRPRQAWDQACLIHQWKYPAPIAAPE